MSLINALTIFKKTKKPDEVQMIDSFGLLMKHPVMDPQLYFYLERYNDWVDIHNNGLDKMRRSNNIKRKFWRDNAL